MTLHEIRLALEGHREAARRRDGWLAWHIAALGRTRRMPKLDRLMPRQRSAEKDLAAALKAAIWAHNHTVQ